MPALNEAAVSHDVVEIDGLVAHYGSRKVLDGIEMRVKRGEIMVIMGGSGSGKSTLLRHMLGLQRPSAGRVRLFGKDLARLPTKALYRLRRKIGVAFQGGALFGAMSVGDNIALPLREHTRLDVNTIRIMSRLKLEMMNLADCEHYMPAELSGGMVKRAALARAIAMDPSLLLFDEPSSGLDPINAAELDEYILQLKNTMGMTIVVVTHELASATRIADRLTVLNEGKILASGSVDEVRQSVDSYIQHFFRRQPRPAALNAADYLRRLTR